MAKKKPQTSELVKPVVKFDGEPHIFEEIFDGEPENMPVLKSVGFAKVKGTSTWVSYVITSKGNDVLKIEVEEPNLRQIAEETAKISFVNELMNQGIVS